MISYKHWFSSKPAHSHKDGLSQAEREAIVDLLNFVTYVDHDISAAEEQLIDGLENQLDWDHDQSFDYYVDKSIAKAREATDEKDQAFFLEQLAQPWNPRRAGRRPSR